jgi:sodium-dependent dicarboxylate transporter 2/3/5
MERPGQIAHVILLIAATLWITEIVPLFVTSLIVLILTTTWLQIVMQQSGIDISRTVFMAPFFSNIILLFLGGFVLSASFQKYRLDEWLAQKIIAKMGTSIPKVMMGIILTTAFLSMWLSNTATAAMMIALCLPIMEGLPEGDRYRKAILLAIPFAANIGGMGTPIGTPPNAIAIQYMQGLGLAPSFGMWVILAIPIVLLLLGIIWAILMIFFRGSSQSINLRSESTERDHSLGEVLVIGVTGLTVFGWLTGGLHGLPSGIVALTPVVVFFGGRILSVQDLRGLPWDVLLLMGGGLCLGVAISQSGLAQWIVARLPTEGASLILLILVFGSVACLMSSLMSNTATANLIMPILIGMSVGNVSPLFIAVAFSCSVAMPLPISTPPNAIAFSTGEIGVKDMIVPGLIATIIGLALVFTVGLQWWRILGVF